MWNELWERHRGKTIGVAGGILFGLLYLIVGFWDMLIFAFIVFIGYHIGRKLDRKESLLEDAEQLWRRLSEKWRMFR
ncbi:MAG: DUF2273 domain-containing protein [Paenibacillaceae bacterium]|uniref:DUF2273 domain-containing protein n=1 Tax=Paenibacillus cymbidii TaxID=1639034 RepID=UPI00107FDFBC|nr:DUF2273 domain-containing protein [Paenibacillus cymbidii]MBO9609044.1 DUF2273 domain-containing protein [Paenibacillaceae bacterium]